jgi:hypothetical protein
MTVQHPVTGQVETLTLTAEMAASLLRAPLYAPALAAALPLAVTRGRRGPVRSAVRPGRCAGRWPAQHAAGRRHALLGGLRRGPAAPRQRPHADRPPDLGDRFAALYRDACAGWPRGDVPADFYTMPPASAPVLVLSGGIDPVTPPRHGERAAQGAGRPGPPRGGAQRRARRDGASAACATCCSASSTPPTEAALAVDAACVESLPRPPAFAGARSPTAHRGAAHDRGRQPGQALRHCRARRARPEPCRRWTASAGAPPTAASPACSGPTAPARPPRCAWWPALIEPDAGARHGGRHRRGPPAARGAGAHGRAQRRARPLPAADGAREHRLLRPAARA